MTAKDDNDDDNRHENPSEDDEDDMAEDEEAIMSDDDDNGDDNENDDEEQEEEEEEEEENEDEDDEDNKEDRGDVGSQSDDDEKSSDDGAFAEEPLGGTIDRPSFALLDGIYEEPKSKERNRVTIPLSRLPATLGRSHDTDDPHFFGLGLKKALSRKHCMIYYRDAQGGRAEWDDDKDELVYKNDEKTKEDLSELKTSAKDLPAEGFFVIECLGKNRIIVDQQRIEQGQSVVISSGSKIQISSYLLYFLLPTDASPKVHTIPGATTSSAATKKRKAPAAAASSNKKNSGAQSHADLEETPVEELLEQISTAIKDNNFGRTHQVMSTIVGLHAIKDSMRDPDIQKEALEHNGGVTRQSIMDFIKNSPKYSDWVVQSLERRDERSYQAAITKSLVKAGYSSTAAKGRYVRWLLPKDIYEEAKQNAQAGGDT